MRFRVMTSVSADLVKQNKAAGGVWASWATKASGTMCHSSVPLHSTAARRETLAVEESGGVPSVISQVLELYSTEAVLRLLLAKEPKLPAATGCWCFQGGGEGVETVQDKDRIMNKAKWISVSSAYFFLIFSPYWGCCSQDQGLWLRQYEFQESTTKFSHKSFSKQSVKVLNSPCFPPSQPDSMQNAGYNNAESPFH